MSNQIEELIRHNKPGLPQATVKSIAEIAESHIGSEGPSRTTIPMSLHILTRLAESNKELKFSTDAGIIKRSHDVNFIVDFDWDEFAIIANPSQMVENQLINQCIKIIEDDLIKTKMKTITSQALIYDIIQIKDGLDHRFIVKLQYGLK